MTGQERDGARDAGAGAPGAGASALGAFEGYVSPFAWRYGSEAMRRIWGERAKRLLWRRIWVVLAEVQQEAGLVEAAQVADLAARAEEVDVARSLELEATLRHDLMAEVHAFAEQCPVGGGIIHLGATSMDVSDNAEVLRQREALGLVLKALDGLLSALAERIDALADAPTMAWTHLQPAEPTTEGYRLAQYAQDLLEDRAQLVQTRDGLRGKGIKGAVGTSASYGQLLEGARFGPRELERRVMARLGLEAFTVSTQTYPRKQDWRVITALAGVGQSLYKLALDVRVLQSPGFGEWAEPFGRQQVGSSAMPFKRNPVACENINSLARLLASLPRVAWDNAAHSVLERTLDDSGNRRVIVPEAFLIVDALLSAAQRVVEGLRRDPGASAQRMAAYGPFAATERVLMEAAKRGGDRQRLHEVIRGHAMEAWAQVCQGRANPLVEALASEPELAGRLGADGVRALMDAGGYVGDAPERARELAARVRAVLA